MLVQWKNWVVGWLFVAESMVMLCPAESKMETDYDNYEDPSRTTHEEIKLLKIQNRLLDILGNSSSQLQTLSQVLGLLNTDTGKEIGKLFMEGFVLGVKQKDSRHILGEFWIQLQDRLSPQLLDSFKDYRDFFKGIDISTLPIIWDQLFKKDELGNSLAGLPLGQLVDMVQPTAAKYGIDIRALMNSFMGQGENNVRDLIISALDNADFSLLMNQLINTTTSVLQMSETDRNSGHKTHDADVHKKKMDKTLHLFRPLVASLLKENEIDLDADAVLEVLSPLFKSDIITQASPWLSMLTGQGDAGGIGSVIANLMGGGKEGFNSQQMVGLLGTLGGLMGNGGGKNQMDMNSILNLASMFMDKKGNKSKSNKKTKKKENDDLDLSSLMNMAGQLMENNNINMDTILNLATRGLKAGEGNKKVNKPGSKVPAKKSQQQNKDPEPKHETSSKAGKKSKNLIDIIEPILLSMKTDKKCNAKVKDAINFGKVLLKNKISSLGDLSQIVPIFIASVTGGDTFKGSGVDIETLTKSFIQAFNQADWNELLVSLENKDFRGMLIRNIAPNTADVVMHLATEETQDKLYNKIVPRIQQFLVSSGTPGVTLDNFPERLAPVLGVLAKGWNLPFNPTTLLVPIKLYVKGLKSWIFAGLEEVKSLTQEEVEKRVIEVLENDVLEVALKVYGVVRSTSDIQCLPQRLCEVSSDLQPDSMKEAITRVVSLVTASGPVLQTSDSNLLFQIVQAISGTKESCKVAFPGDCISPDQEKVDEDSPSMNLVYEHQEL